MDRIEKARLHLQELLAVASCGHGKLFVKYEDFQEPSKEVCGLGDDAPDRRIRTLTVTVEE